jgi:hypothetical protein
MKRLGALVAAVALGASAAAAVAASPPPFPRLPGAWSHAEINVTIRRVPHTLILDRGKIVQASAAQVTLRELGGVRVVVPLSSQTIVVVDGVPSTIYALHRRMQALTMRIDGGAAVRVRATSPVR